jgi:hypothetical protein
MSAAPGSRGGWPAFLGAAAVLALAIVGSPLISGRAYSQADILFGEYPWAAYAPAAFDGPANSLLGDVPMVFYPNLAFARARVRQGQLPLWNADLFGGQPFLGATQTAVFSPITAIAYLVPLPDALGWIYLTRLMLGGTGMFVLLGAAGLSPSARMFGALAWLLSPFVVVWLAHPVAEVAAWMPWLVWGTWKVCHRPRCRETAGLALLMGAGWFSGHPETLLKVLLFCGLLAVTLSRSRTRHDPPGARARPRLAMAAAGMLLGVAVAAVQILPSLEYLQHSRTLADRTRGGANIFVVPLETAVTAVVPNFLGHPGTRTYLPMENRYGLPSNYAEQQAYAGILVWLLAAVGAWHQRREGLTRALVAAMILAALLMYGVPIVTDLVTRLPGLDVVVLSRFGLIVTFSAVWLAAMGLHALTEAPGVTSPTPAAIAACGMGFLVGAAATFLNDALGASGRWPATAAWIGWAVLLTTAGLALMHAVRAGWLERRAAVCGALLLLVVDLTVFAWGFHPSIAKSMVFPRLPEIARVQEKPGRPRVAGWGRAFLPNAATVYGLADPRGYDGIGPRLWTELLDTGMTVRQFHEGRDLRALRLMNLLGVGYLFGDAGLDLPAGWFTREDVGPAPVWRNDRAFPRAFLTDRFVVASRQEDVARLLQDEGFDLRQTAVLSQLPQVAAVERAGVHVLDTAAPVGGRLQEPQESARLRHYRDTFVEIETHAAGPRLLVLSDAFFPGWEVSVDGRPVPLLRAYHALRAVVVPAGEHLVRFDYRPRSVRIGALLTVLAASVAGLMLLPVLNRSKAQDGPA